MMKLTNKEQIENIFNALFEAEIQTADDARNYLIEEGYDPDELCTTGMRIIDEIRRRMK